MTNKQTIEDKLESLILALVIAVIMLGIVLTFTVESSCVKLDQETANEPH